MLFTRSRLELIKEFSKMAKQLAPAGMFWVSWPKKSSGVATEVDENVVREIGLAAGLGRCKSLRLSRRVVGTEVRPASPGS